MLASTAAVFARLIMHAVIETEIRKLLWAVCAVGRQIDEAVDAETEMP